MRARAIRLSPSARNELDDIWDHVAEQSVERADELIDRLLERCKRLCTTPGLGRAIPHPRYHARLYPVRSYVIVYVVEPEAIWVVHITHGSRDLERVFRDKP